LHAVYDGELPGDVVEAKPALDDRPWGVNDDVPVVEIYQSRRKVGVLTGRKVSGAPVTVEKCDEDALEAMLDATGDYDPTNDNTNTRSNTSSDAVGDADGFSGSGQGPTDDMQDVIDAIDRLDAQDVAEKTIVAEWLEGPGAEYRNFRPTWASADYCGTAVYCTEDAFHDDGKRGGSGGPVVMAAIDLGEDDRGINTGDIDGADWINCVEWLRQLGFNIPRLSGGGGE